MLVGVHAHEIFEHRVVVSAEQDAELAERKRGLDGERKPGDRCDPSACGTFFESNFHACAGA